METQSLLLKRIVSGGQTGVDRAALDTAIALGFEHGGWCPLGRRAEDGVIPDCYRLTETESVLYGVRTELNIVDSDATLILAWGALAGGTEHSRRLARLYQRPCLVVDLQATPDVSHARTWLQQHAIRTLNIAGPRESSVPGITPIAARFLQELLKR